MMQLQIKHARLPAQKQQNGLQTQQKQLMYQTLYPVIHQPSTELLQQLNEIGQSAKAHLFYLKRLKIKIFNILYSLDYTAELQLLQKCLFCFKYSRLQKKLRITNQLNLIFNMKRSYAFQLQKRQKTNKSLQHYSKRTQKTIFLQIKQFVLVQKKFKTTEQMLRQNRRLLFICNLKKQRYHKIQKRLQNMQTEQIISQIYQKKLLIKYFAQFIIGKKINKLQKYRKKHYFRNILNKAKQFLLQCQKLYDKFKKKQQIKQLKYAFETFNENRLINKTIQWKRIKIIKFYFDKWNRYYIQKYNEKQIEQSNQTILLHYLELKSPERQFKLVSDAFLNWKQVAKQQKARKYQQKIVKSFTQIKYKQFLLRKCFSALNENQKFQKAKRFYSRKIKIIVFDSFRQFLIKQSIKLQSYFKFVENRNVKRYFDKIKQFNKKQKQKINFFMLKKIWLHFTLNITQQYFNKINKAQNFYAILLKFKAILVLKSNSDLNNKAGYFAHYLNIAKPFKRWHNHFKIRKFVYFQELILMKKIFFEMKCQAICKQKTNNLNYQNSLLQNAEIKTFSLGSMIISKIKDLQSSRTQNQQLQEQISFFRPISSKTQQMDQSCSNYQKNAQSDEQDEIQKRIDSLILRKNQRQKPKTKKFKDQYQQTHQKRSQRIRIPTWSTPDNDYKVSIFQEENI